MDGFYTRPHPGLRTLPMKSRDQVSLSHPAAADFNLNNIIKRPNFNLAIKSYSVCGSHLTKKKGESFKI